MFFKALAYCGDGVVQPGAHRADGDGERLGDLSIRQPLGKPQVEDFALERGQARDGLARGIHPIILGRCRRDHLRRSGGVERDDDFTGLPRPRGLAEVTRNAKQVAPGALRLAAILESAGHLEEGLLHKVMHQFGHPMTSREIARQISGALGEEALKEGGLVGRFHRVFAAPGVPRAHSCDYSSVDQRTEKVHSILKSSCARKKHLRFSGAVTPHARCTIIGYQSLPRLLFQPFTQLPMGFFDRLFNRNPTAEFPVPTEPVSLVWNTSENHLNGIRHGSPLSDLAPLGPCPVFRRHSDSHYYCVYPALGLEVEYCQDLVESIVFLVSEDPGAREVPDLVYARPLIAPAGTTLTPHLDADTLTSFFGRFELVDKDEEEMIGNFIMGKMYYEAEFAPDTRLKRLTIFVDE